jgi:uncharacterized protein with HEPN domain
MKPELGDRQRLLHILDAINLIDEFLAALSEDDFRSSALHRSATERQLEIIGEAANAVSEELKIQYSDVEWQPIRRFRNVIVHEYFGISTQILWGVIQKELPILKVQVTAILEVLES